MKNNCNTQNTCRECSTYIQDIGYCVDCNGESCELVYESDCVIYKGDKLEKYGVKDGDSLTNVILKLLQITYGECTSTTTVCPTRKKRR
jgi:hypothetical protein